LDDDDDEQIVDKTPFHVKCTEVDAMVWVGTRRPSPVDRRPTKLLFQIPSPTVTKHMKGLLSHLYEPC